MACTFAVALFNLGPRQPKMVQTGLGADELIASYGTTLLPAEPIQAKPAQALEAPPPSAALLDKLVGHASTVVGTVPPFSTSPPSSMDVQDVKKGLAPDSKPTLADIEGRPRVRAGERASKVKRHKGSVVVLRNRH